ncbi:ABC transporter permease [Enteractinococcus coprophilus]|uniref:Peptide/nickel transport system permease protein n=1 Tax=Enteractinococcus coprophilus TaxID=1027633 RepID=A0A543AGF8_9MICC|nr:ABC transporter permease [Enteractinococcus coprophilus]TQL71596.1 peptide/nickel transport system permease protein [Enteractinococcus coprophilus]
MRRQQSLQASAAPPRPLIRRVWQQPSGKVGMVLTAIMLVIAVGGYLFADVITGHYPTDVIGQPFDSAGIAGTDIQGRSVASRVLAGGLTLLGYSLVATIIGLALGTVLGLLAGYLGGVIDWIIMRVNDVVLVFPALVLVLLVIAVFDPAAWIIVLVLGLVHAPWVARRIRNTVRSITSQDYILAARMYVTSHWTILTREILPQITGRLAAEFALRLTYSIGLMASLSFLGVGIQPPTPDWGLMIKENLVALTSQPWGVLLPIIAIALLTTGTRLLAHAIAQATALTAKHTS